MKTIENTAPGAEVAVIPRAPTPTDMITLAVEKGSSMEVIEKLMALRERWEANEARKDFEAALAAARAEIKPIAKNRHVGFDSKKPGASRTDYRHEDLAEIARTIDPVLSNHGLSYRYRSTSLPNEPITVTCIVFGHGHSEETTLSAGRDESGNKNSIQAMGSTVTYLQRYTLKSALGLAASNDDDGKGAEGGDVLSPEQADELNRLVIESKTDINKFLKWAGVESIADIKKDYFQSCKDTLEERREAVAKKGTAS